MGGDVATTARISVGRSSRGSEATILLTYTRSSRLRCVREFDGTLNAKYLGFGSPRRVARDGEIDVI